MPAHHSAFEHADALARIAALKRSYLESVCDSIVPWAHGTIARASRHPHFWMYNLLLVESDPRMSVAELAAVADGALDGLEHRMIDFEVFEPAMRMRADFERAGWETTVLLWMRFGGAAPATPPAPAAGIEVREVPYDAVHELRVAWHEEDHPGTEAGEYLSSRREVASAQSARVLGGFADGELVAFGELIGIPDGAVEVSGVFVRADHRRRGLGEAVTAAAIALGRDAPELWITADDEYHAKDLYKRLGFEPACRTIEYVLQPPAAAGNATDNPGGSANE